MSRDVKRGTTPTLELYHPDATGALASVSVGVYSPANVLLATITGAVDDADDTISAATNQTELTVSDGTQFSAGRRYTLLARSGPEPITVQRVAANTLHLANRPADSARVGDSVVGLRATAALTSACTTTAGLHYRAEWTVTQSDGAVLYAQTTYHVVEMPLGRVVTTETIMRILQQYGLDAAERFGAAQIGAMADAAEECLRQKIEGVARYPHRYGDPAQFRPAGVQATRLVLAREWGLVPAAFDGGAAQWEYECRRNLDRDFDLAIKQLGWYDDDDSREPDAQPNPQIFSTVIEL